MEKPNALSYPVEIRIIGNYFLAITPDFDFRTSAGDLLADSGSPDKVTTQSIGNAVLAVYQEIQKKIDNGQKAARNEQGETVKIGQVCEALGLSSSSVRRLIEAGKLDCIRTGGGHRLITCSSLRRYVAKKGLN